MKTHPAKTNALRALHCLIAAICLPILTGTARADATALIATGRADLVSHNIVGANTAFQGAVSADPTNPEANALYALTRIAVLETTSTGTTLLNQMGMSGTGRNLFNWTAKFTHGFPAPHTALTSDQFKTFAKNTLLPQIVGAEGNLAQVTGTAFTTTLSMQETGLPDVSIDYGDIQICRAMLAAAVMSIDTDESYDTLAKFSDIGTWLQTNAMTMQQLVAKYPNLATVSGTASLAPAVSAFNDLANDYAAGSAFIRNRADNTGQLFVIDPSDAAQEATLRAELQSAQSSIAQSTAFDSDTQIDIGVLNTATPSLRALLPSYKYNHPIAGTFPDPTFAGTLPGMSAGRVQTYFTRLGDWLDKRFHHRDDPTPPTVAISSPAANAKIAGGNNPTYMVTVTGTAKDNVAVANVQVSLSQNGQVVASGTASGISGWTYTFANVPAGLNTVSAWSVDTSGNVSKTQTRSFTYVVNEQLPVTIVGSGTVTAGYAPSSQRQLAQSYTIVAKPAAGFYFQSWTIPTGSVYDPNNDPFTNLYSTSPSYTFTMTDNLALQANFIQSPYPSLAGQYTGQLTDFLGDVTGFTAITISSNGSFTGKVLAGGRSYSVKGKLDGLGNASLTLPDGKNAHVYINIFVDDLADITQGIFVGFSGDNYPGDFYSAQAYHGPSATPIAGKYTMTIAGDNTEPDSPQGTGYGAITVSPDAKVSFVGVLADGTPLSFTTALMDDNTWVCYVPLYGGQGSFSAQVDFSTVSPGSDATGTATWIEPPTNQGIFQAGFFASPTLAASTYVKQSPVLLFPAGGSNGSVSTQGGNLITELQDTITLTNANKVTVVTPGPDRLKFTINSTNGEFSGSFFDVDTQTVRLFGGVIMQTDGFGTGYFLGDGQSGIVTFATP